MNGALLLMIWLLPILLATLAGKRHARWLLPLATLPGLLAVAVLPVGTAVSLPYEIDPCVIPVTFSHKVP